MARPTRIVIDHGALRHNLRRVREAAPGRKVMAIVKANAYGHGLVRVARGLGLAGVDGFGVASLEEALALREAGLDQPITLLEGHFSADEPGLMAGHHIAPMLHRHWQVEILERSRLSAPLRVWIKIDTGMHRLGFEPEQLGSIARRLLHCPSVAGPVGLATHLACADQRGSVATERQLAAFQAHARAWPGPLSVANSAAVLAWPKAHADWVRPGIMLYGVSPFVSGSAAAEGLRPVMTLSSRLISVKYYPKGAAIGYGASWRCPEPMPVGVVAVGYGDGYPRHAPAGTPLLVNGERAPLVGRVSMDMVTVDLRRHPEARVGDPVVCWGEGLPVEEVAAKAGTIGYELLCSVTARVRAMEIGLARKMQDRPLHQACIYGT